MPPSSSGNSSPDAAAASEAPASPASAAPAVPVAASSEPPAAPSSLITPTPPTSPEPDSSVPPPVPPAPSDNNPPLNVPSSSKRGHLDWLLLGIASFITLGSIGFGLWGLFGEGESPPAAPTPVATVDIPKNATVTADCVDQRGKQYIIPKDIPMGPIYDVYQGRVIAIEYLASQNEITASPSMFANLNLPHATYDHLTFVPTAPHAGMAEPHFHAILYFISAHDASQIKCSASTTSTNTMHM